MLRILRMTMVCTRDSTKRVGRKSVANSRFPPMPVHFSQRSTREKPRTKNCAARPASAEAFRRAVVEHQDYEARQYIEQLDEQCRRAIEEGKFSFSVGTSNDLSARVRDRIHQVYPSHRGFVVCIETKPARIGSWTRISVSISLLQTSSRTLTNEW